MKSTSSTSTTSRPTCNCRAPSIWPWPRPSRGSGAIRRRAEGRSRRCSRPARGSACRCSSTSAIGCASTRARANTCHVRRTEQRRAAVWALYQSDLLGRPLEETLPRDTHSFTRALAGAVREHQPELDELISAYSSGWTLERIAPLERSILRVGLVELLYAHAV